MAGGQVAARRGQRLQIAAIGKLRRIVGGMIGRLRRKGARDGQRGEGECGNGPAIETNGKHTVRLAPGFYGSSRMRTQPAASRQPTMPRLAFNRKDTGRRIDWPGNVPAAPTRLKTLSVWRDRGPPPPARRPTPAIAGPI